MKRRLTVILFALTMLFATRALPAYAALEEGSDPPPCSQCDGKIGGYWG